MKLTPIVLKTVKLPLVAVRFGENQTVFSSEQEAVFNRIQQEYPLNLEPKPQQKKKNRFIKAMFMALGLGMTTLLGQSTVNSYQAYREAQVQREEMDVNQHIEHVAGGLGVILRGLAFAATGGITLGAAYVNRPWRKPQQPKLEG